MSPIAENIFAVPAKLWSTAVLALTEKEACLEQLY